MVPNGDLKRMSEAYFMPIIVQCVIAPFNHYTRVADALGGEPEEFIRPWRNDDGGAAYLTRTSFLARLSFANSRRLK